MAKVQGILPQIRDTLVRVSVARVWNVCMHTFLEVECSHYRGIYLRSSIRILSVPREAKKHAPQVMGASYL